MVIKMVALGIFGKKCYLGDTWNRLDFFIVLAGWVPCTITHTETVAQTHRGPSKKELNTHTHTTAVSESESLCKYRETISLIHFRLVHVTVTVVFVQATGGAINYIELRTALKAYTVCPAAVRSEFLTCLILKEELSWTHKVIVWSCFCADISSTPRHLLFLMPSFCQCFCCQSVRTGNGDFYLCVCVCMCVCYLFHTPVELIL